MPLDRTDSVLSILSCKEEEYDQVYNGAYVTAELIEDAKSIIERWKEELVSNKERKVDLYKLLKGMLLHAPSSSGQRYVAVVLHIAAPQGVQTVVEFATAWLERKAAPSMVLSPSFDATAVVVEAASRNDQAQLRRQVAHREDHRCIITGFIDMAHVRAIVAHQQLPVPPGQRATLNAAHIIPYSLNDFEEAGDELKLAAYTWDILQAWSGLDIQDLAGDKINNASNAILMNTLDHGLFGELRFYFEEDPTFANRYTIKVQEPNRGLTLSTGHTEQVVLFSNTSGIDPPDPRLLKIHAALAKAFYFH